MQNKRYSANPIWQSIQQLVQKFRNSFSDWFRRKPRKNASVEPRKKSPQQIFAEDLRQRSNEPLWLDPQLARALARAERAATLARRFKGRQCVASQRIVRWVAMVIVSVIFGSTTILIADKLAKAGKKAVNGHVERVSRELEEE